jgi:intracellular multiplication protein IcmB
MTGVFEKINNVVSPFIGWLGTAFKQTTAAYCNLETADSTNVLVTNDGSLLSIIKLEGSKSLVGGEEFDMITHRLQQSLHTIMSQPGHSIQVYFNYDRDLIKDDLAEIIRPGRDTAKRLGLDLEDLFGERIEYLSKYCAHEDAYLVLYTNTTSLTSYQLKHAYKERARQVKEDKIPPFVETQNPMRAIIDLRESHDAFVRSVVTDFNQANLANTVLEVHEALRVVKTCIDPEFTDPNWSPQLPGDKIHPKVPNKVYGEVSDVLWPSLKAQLFSRDAINLDLRVAQIGDRIYSTVFIDLFPREVQTFMRLFSRTLQANIPWRLSFMIDSDGMNKTGMRAMMASVLGFSSRQNRLITDSLKLLNYINLNSDDAVVKLRVCASTWANIGEDVLLRARVSQLARAIEGWGSCTVSQVCGDAFEGAVSSMLAVTDNSVSSASLAPLSDVLEMLPLFRPASYWKHGAMMFRSPDGKPLPYQPGSSQQTTWIDLFYARPGSGKSVLSNAINLAVCLSSGIARLPRIAIVDIGPSSSGLINLLKDALPASMKHQAAYHRLRMTSEHAINPFDTQLGCRYPMPQDRAFLVNFLTLLVTPVGQFRSYDGVADMSGLIVDELYKQLADTGNPNVYAPNIEPLVDEALQESGFVVDKKSSWWEICDALFVSGFKREAKLAQRYAMPVLADIAAICRGSAIKDLYGKIITPTGEDLIQAYSRMISAAVREYPIISQVTKFDLDDAKIVALDLDEVARSGGDAANRQTAVMYMLARYVLARHYFLTQDNVAEMPESYRKYHHERISEIREDPKRIVFDEFHRTANAQSVRDQVIIDMREGRKWKIQIALLSQSLDDFDSVMVEFATSVFIMDAGPEQAIRKTAEVFGLSQTARRALKNHVHGPSRSGATFLAQFATKSGVNTQLLTSTLGPIELWALNTTAEDVNIRNQLYRRLGSRKARRLLAQRFPTGSAVKELEERYINFKQERDFIDEDDKANIFQEFIEEIISFDK